MQIHHTPHTTIQHTGHSQKPTAAAAVGASSASARARGAGGAGRRRGRRPLVFATGLERGEVESRESRAPRAESREGSSKHEARARGPGECRSRELDMRYRMARSARNPIPSGDHVGPCTARLRDASLPRPPRPCASHTTLPSSPVRLPASLRAPSPRLFFSFCFFLLLVNTCAPSSFPELTENL
jgi:hypothetical protein